jgi:hypothetical protein
MMVTNEHRGPGRGPRALAGAAALLAATAGGCDDDDDVDTEVVTPAQVYPEEYAFTADLAAADVFWADDWPIDPFLFSKATTAAPPTVRAQGVAGLSAREPGAALRALARGEDVCPGKVTIVSKTTTTPCHPDAIRAGATISFSGCVLEGGGRLDGALDVQSAAEVPGTGCDADTPITVSYTASYTDLVYTAPDGTRVAIPALMNTGTYTRPRDGAPAALTVTTTGRLQRYDAAGALITDHGLSGMRGYIFTRNGVPSSTYTIGGTLTVQDTASGLTVTATGAGVTRAAGCCHPVGGAIVVAGTGWETATWSYGPACGTRALNGESNPAPACP